MDLIKAIVLGTIYTLLGFGLSFLFLHIGTMYWYHQTAVQFLGEMNVQRIVFQQFAQATDPGSIQAILLKDKVFFGIIYAVLIISWLMNINRQWNKED
jgi:hypothetical protein